MSIASVASFLTQQTMSRKITSLLDADYFSPYIKHPGILAQLSMQVIYHYSEL